LKTTLALTGKQAAMIAEFAGYTVSEETDPMVTDHVQIIVRDTDGTPITEDDGTVTKHHTITYDQEAEEEGVCSLDSGDPSGLT